VPWSATGSGRPDRSAARPQERRGRRVYRPRAGSRGTALPSVGSLVAFVAALLIGGLAIYVSARVVADVDDYGHAVVTALVGAIGWALTAWIPLIGPLIALVVWIGVINWRYPGGWIKAATIGLGAWLSALVILLVLNSALGLGIGAFGVPGA
jgi:hypothetical protein